MNIHMDNTQEKMASQILDSIPTINIQSLMLPGTCFQSQFSTASLSNLYSPHTPALAATTSLTTPSTSLTSTSQKKRSLDRIPLTFCYCSSWCNEKGVPSCCALDPLTSCFLGTSYHHLPSHVSMGFSP